MAVTKELMKSTSAPSAGAYARATEMAKSGTAGQPQYDGSFDRKLAELYDQIQNREKFKFDLKGDALYDQYKDQYVQGGKMAMRDSMGKAAALTGGYGSSYGQSVGQQQYDAYLQKLNEVVPELYDQAYQHYRDEGSDLAQQYAMAGERASQEYSRYRDQVGDWQYERAWQQQQEEQAYNRQQDAYKQLYQMIAATGYQPTAAELSAAGMSSAAAAALRSAWQQANAGGSGGGSGSGGYSGGSSGSGGGKNGTTYSQAQSDVKALVEAGVPYEQIRDAIAGDSSLTDTERRKLVAQAAADTAKKNSVAGGGAKGSSSGLSQR